MAATPWLGRCLVSGVRQLSSRITYQSCPGLATHHFSKVSSVRFYGATLAARGYSSNPAPPDYRFTKDHEWVKIDGNIGTVGISDHAQSELGDVVFVETPEVGGEVSRGDTFGVVESVKAVSDIYAPLSGTVAEVNTELEDHPELVNDSPYEDGWIAKFELSNVSEIDDLLTLDQYNEYLSAGDE